MEREGDQGLSPQEKVEDESEWWKSRPPAMNLKGKQKNMCVFINSRETMFVKGQSSQQF